MVAAGQVQGIGEVHALGARLQRGGDALGFLGVDVTQSEQVLEHADDLCGLEAVEGPQNPFQLQPVFAYSAKIAAQAIDLLLLESKGRHYRSSREVAKIVAAAHLSLKFPGPKPAAQRATSALQAPWVLAWQ